MPIQKTEITGHVKRAVPRVIKKEHEFRIEYLHKRYVERITPPRTPFFQLEEGLCGGAYIRI